MAPRTDIDIDVISKTCQPSKLFPHPPPIHPALPFPMNSNTTNCLRQILGQIRQRIIIIMEEGSRVSQMSHDRDSQHISA